MADIFVSYSREDRDRVEPLAHALEAEGFSVWWDPELPIGQSYSASIRAALNEARAVIPVWTTLSVQSEWVQEEATHGKRRGVLFPVLLDMVEPPMGFTMVETADLVDWQDVDGRHPEWSRLLQQLHAKLRGTTATAEPPGRGGVRRDMGTRSGWRIGSAAAAAALLLAVAAAMFLVWRGSEDGPDNRTSISTPRVPRDVPAPAVKEGANSTIADARRLAVGTAEPGEILTRDDTRFYAVPNRLKLRDRAIVRLQNESTTLKPYIKIFDGDGSYLAERYDTSAGASVAHVLTLTPGQPIYVQVLPNNSVGRYRISVTPQEAYDAFEPNDSLVTPAAGRIGNDIRADVMDDKDSDFYRFTRVPNHMIKVTFENLSATLRPQLRVYDFNKSEIVEKYDTTRGANLTFDVDLKQSPDFYVEVSPYSTFGAYRLRVD